MYQMAIMGSSAVGAAVWGQAAGLVGLAPAMGVAALTGIVAGLLAARLANASVAAISGEEDFTPSRALQPAPIDPQPGCRVVITIEYVIDPARAAEFMSVMMESRRSRLRRGALDWELMHDAASSVRYVERIVDASWLSASDVTLRERKAAFHISPHAPKVHRYIVAA